jgi:hypothetical protein
MVKTFVSLLSGHASYYHPHLQIKKKATCHNSLAWFTCYRWSKIYAQIVTEHTKLIKHCQVSDVETPLEVNTHQLIILLITHILSLCSISHYIFNLLNIYKTTLVLVSCHVFLPACLQCVFSWYMTCNWCNRE